MRLHARGECFGGIFDTHDFGAVGVCGDQERRQTPTHTDPATVICRITRGVVVGGVQVGGRDIQTAPPPPGALGNISVGTVERLPRLGTGSPVRSRSENCIRIWLRTASCWATSTS